MLVSITTRSPSASLQIKSLASKYTTVKSPFTRFNPFNPKRDQHLIPLYSNTAESFINIFRMKEMITNQRNSDC